MKKFASIAVCGAALAITASYAQPATEYRFVPSAQQKLVPSANGLTSQYMLAEPKSGKSTGRRVRWSFATKSGGPCLGGVRLERARLAELRIGPGGSTSNAGSRAHIEAGVTDACRRVRSVGEACRAAVVAPPPSG